MATAPAGALVGIYYDGLVARGQYLRTRTGRLYEVVSVRVHRRGVHLGRRHLQCIVRTEAPQGAAVRPLYWYPRVRGRRPSP